MPVCQLPLPSQKLPIAHGSAPHMHPTAGMGGSTTPGVVPHATLLLPVHTPVALHVSPTGHRPTDAFPHGHASVITVPILHGATHVASTPHQCPAASGRFSLAK